MLSTHAKIAAILYAMTGVTVMMWTSAHFMVSLNLAEAVWPEIAAVLLVTIWPSGWCYALKPSRFPPSLYSWHFYELKGQKEPDSDTVVREFFHPKKWALHKSGEKGCNANYTSTWDGGVCESPKVNSSQLRITVRIFYVCIEFRLFDRH